jgi:hypothetical protein
MMTPDAKPNRGSSDGVDTTHALGVEAQLAVGVCRRTRGEQLFDSTFAR